MNIDLNVLFPKFSDFVGSFRFYRQHRYRGKPYHLFGYASHQHMANPRSAVRRHDNKVCVKLADGFDYSFNSRSMAYFELEIVRNDGVVHQEMDDGSSGREFSFFSFRSWQQVGRFLGLDHMKDYDFCIEQSRDLFCIPKGFKREFRKVGW